LCNNKFIYLNSICVILFNSVYCSIKFLNLLIECFSNDKIFWCFFLPIICWTKTINIEYCYWQIVLTFFVLLPKFCGSYYGMGLSSSLSSSPIWRHNGFHKATFVLVDWSLSVLQLEFERCSVSANRRAFF
jgi:hypothetical protein